MNIELPLGLTLKKNPSIIANNETLVRRLRKLGDYYAAASSITAALMDKAIYKMRANISFTEVSLGFFPSILAL
jgi:hypothetical protein